MQGIVIERAFGFPNQRDLDLSAAVDPLDQQDIALENGREYLFALVRGAEHLSKFYPHKSTYLMGTKEGRESHQDDLCDFHTRLDWLVTDLYEREHSRNVAQRIKFLGHAANELLLATLVRGRFNQRNSENPSKLARAVDEWIDVLAVKDVKALP